MTDALSVELFLEVGLLFFAQLIRSTLLTLAVLDIARSESHVPR